MGLGSVGVLMWTGVSFLKRGTRYRLLWTGDNEATLSKKWEKFCECLNVCFVIRASISHFSLFLESLSGKCNNNMVVFPLDYHIAVQQPFRTLWLRPVATDMNNLEHYFLCASSCY
jgi:hypothetical protein